MTYWMKSKKGDGSFDEFYPNERGWAGPTGFLLYAMIRLLPVCWARAFPEQLQGIYFYCLLREGGADLLARWDEPGVLANHHAMAVLPVFEAARLLGSRLRSEDRLSGKA